MRSAPSFSRSQRRLHLEELEPRLVLSGTQPTAVEQQFLELLNDARANPAAYGASIGLDLSYISPSAPLAWDARLVQSARGHSQAMNNQAFFAHTNPFTGLDPGGRIAAAGYSFITWGESIAAGTVMPTPADALKALIVDAGVADLGHRNHLLANGAAYSLQTQVGIGIVQNGSGPYTDYYTIDTAGNADSRPFIEGVVFNDQNGTGQYAPGEELAGVTITVAGAGSTTSFVSGGYSLRVSPGTYTVTASGGALPTPVSTVVQVGAGNVRVNFTPGSATVAAPPKDPLASWVGLLYRDILHRTAAPAEVGAWVGWLHQGLPRSAAVTGFLNSAEHDRDLLGQIYQQYLHRAPDDAGLGSWVAAMQRGLTESQVRQAVLASDEYLTQHGGSADTFVQSLYADVLGRTPQYSEDSGWIAMASTGDRASVIAAIMHSAELDARIVGGLYQTYLRRSADSGGVNSFVNYIQATNDPYFGLVSILLSGEYLTGAQSW